MLYKGGGVGQPWQRRAATVQVDVFFGLRYGGGLRMIPASFGIAFFEVCEMSN